LGVPAQPARNAAEVIASKIDLKNIAMFIFLLLVSPVANQGEGDSFIVLHLTG
jgi:hypothetical protein